MIKHRRRNVRQVDSYSIGSSNGSSNVTSSNGSSNVISSNECSTMETSGFTVRSVSAMDSLRQRNRLFPKGCLKVRSSDSISNYSDLPVRQSTHRPRIRKMVSFQDVYIREYERVVGDNPSCTSGVPVSLGWQYSTDKPLLIDDFEKKRLLRSQSNRTNFQLTRTERERMLLEWGTSFQDIAEAVRANQRVKHQRRRTVNSLGTYDRIEEIMENTRRKISKSLSMGKRSNKKVAIRYPSSESDGSRSETSPPNSSDTVSISFAEMADPNCDCEALSADENNFVEQQGKEITRMDKPLLMPRRSASPVSLHNVYLADITMNRVSGLSSQDFMSSENNRRQIIDNTEAALGLSIVASENFDVSITSYDTRWDNTCLAVSFTQPIDVVLHENNKINDQCKIVPAMNAKSDIPIPLHANSMSHNTSQSESLSIDNSCILSLSNPLDDDETTINTNFYRSNVNTSNINVTIMAEDRRSPTFDDETTISTRYFHVDRDLTQFPDSTSPDVDDESSIDSQYMDLLEEDYMSGQRKPIDAIAPSTDVSIPVAKSCIPEKHWKCTAIVEPFQEIGKQYSQEVKPVTEIILDRSSSHVTNIAPEQHEAATTCQQSHTPNLVKRNNDQSESATVTTSSATVTTTLASSATNSIRRKPSSRRRRYAVTPDNVTELVEL